MLDSVLVIRFQILVRTETGGGPAGPPVFILKAERGEAMLKPFFTYDRQLISCHFCSFYGEQQTVSSINERFTITFLYGC